MYESYKNHPRMLELRFAILYTDLIRIYGVEATHELIAGFCTAFRINHSLIVSVISKTHEILGMRLFDLNKYRQQVTLMGLSRGYTASKIASNLLGISRQTYYNTTGGVDPETFITEEWLFALEHSITALGLKAYANEVFKFLSEFEALGGVL